jgi:hypothetical protein
LKGSMPASEEQLGRGPRDWAGIGLASLPFTYFHE